MRVATWLGYFWLILIAPAQVLVAQQLQPNSLSPQEVADGWRLLFDGRTTAGWRGYKSPGVPESWQVENGSLLSRRKTGLSSGDLVTTDQFADFELLVDWKMTRGNNSGIIYRATEEHDQVWQSALSIRFWTTRDILTD